MINAKAYFWLFTGLIFLASFSLYAAERREVEDFVEFGDPVDATLPENVRTLIDAFKETWAAQDVEGHASLFAEDAEWINAYARMFRGREDLSVFLRDRLFANFDSEVSQEEMSNIKLVSIRYLGDDTVVVHMYTDSRRGESAIAGELLRRTHIHLVIAKLEDELKIVHTAIMDARE